MATSIDRSHLLGLIESEDAQIVDVLPASEYAESHLPGAISFPLRQLTADTASILSPDGPGRYWEPSGRKLSFRYELPTRLMRPPGQLLPCAG